MWLVKNLFLSSVFLVGQSIDYFTVSEFHKGKYVCVVCMDSSIIAHRSLTLPHLLRSRPASNLELSSAYSIEVP